MTQKKKKLEIEPEEHQAETPEDLLAPGDHHAEEEATEGEAIPEPEDAGTETDLEIDEEGDDDDTEDVGASLEDPESADRLPHMRLPRPVAIAHAVISGGILSALIVFLFVSLFSIGTDSQISDTVIKAIDANTVSSDELESILTVLQQHQDAQALTQLRAIRMVSVFLGATLLLTLGAMLSSAVIFGSKDQSGMWGTPAGKSHWMTPPLIAITLGGGLLIAGLSMDLTSGTIHADSDQLRTFVDLLQTSSGDGS